MKFEYLFYSSSNINHFKRGIILMQIIFKSQKSNAKMDSKLITCILIIATNIISTLAYDKTNKNQTTELGNNEEELKNEYGCTPLDQWMLIKQHSNGAFIKDACMTNSYQIFRPPSLPILTNVVVAITNQQILEIDEFSVSDLLS